MLSVAPECKYSLPPPKKKKRKNCFHLWGNGNTGEFCKQVGFGFFKKWGGGTTYLQKPQESSKPKRLRSPENWALRSASAAHPSCAARRRSPLSLGSCWCSSFFLCWLLGSRFLLVITLCVYTYIYVYILWLYVHYIYIYICVYVHGWCLVFAACYLEFGLFFVQLPLYVAFSRGEALDVPHEGPSALVPSSLPSQIAHTLLQGCVVDLGGVISISADLCSQGKQIEENHAMLRCPKLPKKGDPPKKDAWSFVVGSTIWQNRAPLRTSLL